MAKAQFADAGIVELTLSFTAPVNTWLNLANQLTTNTGINSSPAWEFGTTIGNLLREQLKSAKNC